MKKILKITAVFLILASLVSCAKNGGSETKDTAENTDTINSESENKTDGEKTSDSENESKPVAEPFDYMNSELTKYIKLGNYTGLKATHDSAEVTEEELESSIETLLENYAENERITDRAAAEGDTVIADYSGFKGEEQFSGGTATEQNIVLSSDSGMIPGFAEAFIGKMPGEEFSFDIAFPENYFNSDLAGAEVTFKCIIHYIEGKLIVPEFTDDFVKETFGYNNTEEFRIAYRASLETQKESLIKEQVYNSLWKQIVDDTEVLSYPEEEVERSFEEMRAYYKDYAEYLKVDYDTFMSSYIGMTDEQLRDQCKASVREDLVLYQLVKELKLELTEEEYSTAMNDFANEFGMTFEDLISYYPEESIRKTVLWQAALDIVMQSAEIVEE